MNSGYSGNSTQWGDAVEYLFAGPRGAIFSSRPSHAKVFDTISSVQRPPSDDRGGIWPPSHYHGNIDTDQSFDLDRWTTDIFKSVCLVNKKGQGTKPILSSIRKGAGMEKILSLFLVALFVIMFNSSLPAWACDAMGPNRHVGVVTKIDQEAGTFMIIDAQLKKPMIFLAQEKLLNTLKLHRNFIITFQKNGKRMEAKAAVPAL